MWRGVRALGTPPRKLRQAALKRDPISAGRRRDSAGKIAAAPRGLQPAVKHLLLLAAVIGVAYLAYANSFHAPLLLDNDEIVLKDVRIHAVTPVQLHRILTQQYWATANNGLYRPLTTLSFLFNYAILGYGEDPYGYHWFNFILHAVNMALVYALGLALFRRIPAALLLSALWGLHPVLTESVTNIVGRADMLAAFSVLAALQCHRKALATTGVRRAVWLAAIGLATAAGIFSKESAIVVVAVLAIYDLTFATAGPWQRQLGQRRLASYGAAAIPCLIYLYVRSQVLAGAPYLATTFCENPLLGAGFWTARMTAIKVIGKYFGLLVWPARLSWDYSYNQIPLFGWGAGHWEDGKALAALLGCAAAAVAAVRSWRGRKPVFFAVAFFFVTLSPTSNLLLLIGTIMGERFLYLPSVGFAAAAVWLLDALWRRVPAGQPAWRYGAAAGLSVLLMAFAFRTYGRNGDWLDPHRFWLSAAAAAPDSYKANITAAVSTYLGTREDVLRSIGYAERSLAILDGLPDSRNAPNAYRDAGTFYLSLGDRVASRVASQDAGGSPSASLEALSWYRKSLQALLRSEKIELAWDQRYQLENARRGKPGLTSLPGKLYLDLGRDYLRLADTPRALAAFERGRTLESDPELLVELASLYRSQGEPRQAAMALVEASAVAPQRADLASTLVELYRQIDPQGCAVTLQAGMAGLNPDCPLVHGDICAASRNVIGNYLRRGQQFEAAAIRGIAERDLGCAAGLLK
jgi:tetratricopeptide (TPR) repeat protein